MSDKQHLSQPTAPPDFGEISIHQGGAPSMSRSAPPPKAAPSEKTARKKSPRSGGRSKGRLCLLLLLALPPLLLLCAAGGLHLLPRYVKGPLAEELGRRLGRPVTIAEASLDPLRFELRLGEITVGAAADRPEEEELARIASLAARIQPAALLRRQLVLEDLRIDRLRAKLLRRADGSFNFLPGKDLSLPDRLRVQGLRLSRSTVHFFDQPSGKKHLVEHIEFVLPAPGQDMEPALSAAVNSSPLQITGQREGGAETKLSVKLDDLDPQQYIGLLPGLAEKLSLSAQRADAVLEIVLQDADKGPAVTGSVTFSKLLAEAADCEEQPECCARLAAPVAHLIVRVYPLQKLWAVEELLLEEPLLELPADQEPLLAGGPLAAKAAVWLNPEDIGLAVGKLTLNKGRVRSGKKEWAEVQLDLSGFQNVKAAALTGERPEAGQLSLAAVSGVSSVAFQGEADPAFNLSGSLSLQNMQADLLLLYLAAADSGLRFTKGSADISGSFKLEQQDGGTAAAFSASAVTVRDFALQRGGKKAAALLSGKNLSGSDCSLDSSGVACGKVVLDQADFADSRLLLPSSGTKSGILRFAAKTLELKNSAALLPVGAAQLPLSGLKLTVQEDRSLKLTAAAGKKGSVEITGAAEKDKNGAVLLTGDIALKNISPSLLDGFLSKDGSIRFSQGAADISGAFRLEQGRMQLSGGTVAVRDFSLQQGKAALVSGKTLSGADCVLNGSGMACGKVLLDQVDFADSGFFLQPAGRLRFSADTLELKNSAARLLLGATQLPLSSLSLSLSGQNNFKLEAAAGGSGRLEISGTAAKSDAGLTVSGSVALREVTASLLDMYLSENGSIRFSQGTAAVSGAGSLTAGAGGAALHLTDSAVAVDDFALQRGGAALLLSGKTLRGAGCVLDSGGSRMSCGSVTLDQANFTDTGFFLQPSGQLRFAADSAEISNSAATLRLAGAAELPLSALNIKLSGLPGQISLNAAAGSGKFELSGEAAKNAAGLSLSGTLALKNVGAALLNPYLGDGLRLRKGSADISGKGSLTSAASGPELHLSIGTVALHDFALEHSGETLLSGTSLDGADCSLDGAARRMSCGSVALAQADFAEAAPAFFFQSKDGLRFTANTVEISGSAAKLPLGSGAARPVLPLSGLNLRLSGLREAQPEQNLTLEAAAGSGSFKAEGSLRRDGSGAAAVTAERLDLRLFSKAFAGLFRDGLAPSLTQGRLSFQGRFTLPESRFTGDFSIEDLAAETSQGDSLRWRRAAASNMAVALAPFAAAAEKIALEEPSLRLTAAESLPAGIFALLQGLPPVSIGQCSLSGGSFERGGSRFSGIEGSFAPVKAGAAAAFSLAGTMNGGNFTVSGSSGSQQAQLEKLAVERLPLLKAGQELARQLALRGGQGQLTRTVSAAEDRLDFSGFAPLPESDYALVLALLTDKEGRFSLPLQGLPAAADEAAVCKAAAEQLQRLRLQSVAAPWAALEKLAPNPAQTLDFIPGGTMPDFMAGLDSLRVLSSLRPRLGWAVRGCYDREADAKPLLDQLRKSGEQELEAENLRRKQELEQLLAQEMQRQDTLNKAGLPIIKDMLPEIRDREDLQPLAARQDGLPEHVLPDLARARAETVRQQLVSGLGLREERVRIEAGAACGAKAELLPVPVW